MYENVEELYETNELGLRESVVYNLKRIDTEIDNFLENNPRIARSAPYLLSGGGLVLGGILGMKSTGYWDFIEQYWDANMAGELTREFIQEIIPSKGTAIVGAISSISTAIGSYLGYRGVVKIFIDD